MTLRLTPPPCSGLDDAEASFLREVDDELEAVDADVREALVDALGLSAR